MEAASSVGRSSFTRVLEEIPVVIHNSHLVNILLTEIVDNQELSRSELSTNSSMLDLAPPLPKDHPGRYSTLNLSMASSLEQQLRSLLAGLETVHDYQYSYQRSLSKSQTTVAGKGGIRGTVNLPNCLYNTTNHEAVELLNAQAAGLHNLSLFHMLIVGRSE
ncbi:uncharacterized protein DC041_0002585 [Schistosoma bovis]|uniref:eIF3h C-terminal domain-containing protein n=1 Tax=Schistosoma bovis TaxID=6184 RepID=A0A430Q388_SCHBO|nr:uncharacterized protein DC041_0002585 [Schistosoma bovis]